jgi:curved DNA-binding protein CbpA
MDNHITDIPTHYTTLGLAPSAPDVVIHAAYRALSLVHHPDKTSQLPAEEQAYHASIFRAIQGAYDAVAPGSTTKAAYDAELERYGNRVDEARYTFRRSMSRSTASTEPTPMHSMEVRTRAEKNAMRLKLGQDIRYLCTQQAKRDAEDANMDVIDWEVMQSVWAGFAREIHNDQALQAYCLAQVQACEAKISKVYEEWETSLKGSSKPEDVPKTTPTWKPKSDDPPKTPTSKKTPPSTPKAPLKAAAPRFKPTTKYPPAPTSKGLKRKEERERALALRASQDTARALARAAEKAQKEAVKQSELNARTEAFRAQKEEHKQRVEAQAKLKAAHNAKARAAAKGHFVPPLEEHTSLSEWIRATREKMERRDSEEAEGEKLSNWDIVEV